MVTTGWWLWEEAEKIFLCGVTSIYIAGYVLQRNSLGLFIMFCHFPLCKEQYIFTCVQIWKNFYYYSPSSADHKSKSSFNVIFVCYFWETPDRVSLGTQGWLCKTQTNKEIRSSTVTHLTVSLKEQEKVCRCSIVTT